MAPRSEVEFIKKDNAPLVPVRQNPIAVKEKLRIDILKKLIPKECFEKSLVKSLFYMFRDMTLIILCWKLYPIYVEGNWFCTFIWWNALGFLMWALFIIGHDCGHTTFSDYSLINNICGHICHAPLLVPFWPWAQSHHQHHSYHNHIERDQSFPWFNKKQYESELTDFGKLLLKSPIHPLFSYGVSYLLMGYWDGSHFNPFSSLFQDSISVPISIVRNQRIKCVVSSLTVAVALWILLQFIFAFDMNQFAVKYAVPWCIFNYWLVLVTYLQHHEPDSITFDDSDYSFAVAAVETVDRKFCFGIDNMHHNITDGHVAHHLFFTKIPHYNLIKATNALKPYLESIGVYRFQKNPFFLWTFVYYNFKYGLFTHSKAEEEWSPDMKCKKKI